MQPRKPVFWVPSFALSPISHHEARSPVRNVENDRSSLALSFFPPNTARSSSETQVLFSAGPSRVRKRIARNRWPRKSARLLFRVRLSFHQQQQPNGQFACESKVGSTCHLPVLTFFVNDQPSAVKGLIHRNRIQITTLRQLITFC